MSVSSLSPRRVLFPFPLRRVRFEIVFEKEGVLPAYPGSAIRGMLGHGLRRVLCVTAQRSCEGCALAAGCGYVHFFETPCPPALRHRFAAVPHPWVLDFEFPMPKVVRSGERLTFYVTLIGDGNDYLAWLILALRHAARRGLGRSKLPFRLDRVAVESEPGCGDWIPVELRGMPGLSNSNTGVPVPAAVPSRIAMQLMTPLRLKRRGALVTPDELSLGLLLSALRLRWRDVIDLYGQPPSEPALPELPAGVDEALHRKQLRWVDWTRYSSRQRTTMQLGGITGSMEFELTGLAQWWPLLWLGQWLHVGKQTSMGLGQYRLWPAGSVPANA